MQHFTSSIADDDPILASKYTWLTLNADKGYHVTKTAFHIYLILLSLIKSLLVFVSYFAHKTFTK